MKKKATLSSVDKKLDTILKYIKGDFESAKEVSQDLIKLEMKDYMTQQYLFDECKKLFDIHSYIDLSIVTSERKGNYSVCFKNVQEADEENKNLSADGLKEKGIKGITLEERLLLEIVYFKKTGKHLDIDNWTLCSGSRNRDGSVPDVGWDSGNGEVRVCWSDPSDRDDNLRTRSAVKILK